MDANRLPILLLDAEETAHVLRTTPEAVQNMHRLGQLPGVLLSARCLRWRLRDVEQFVERLTPGGDR